MVVEMCCRRGSNCFSILIGLAINASDEICLIMVDRCRCKPRLYKRARTSATSLNSSIGSGSVFPGREKVKYSKVIGMTSRNVRSGNGS